MTREQDPFYDVCKHCGLIRGGHNIHGDCPPISRSTRFEKDEAQEEQNP
jgi:hypothetical protein